MFHLVLRLLLLLRSLLLRVLGLLSGKLHGLGDCAFTEAGVEAASKGLKVALAPSPGGPSSVRLHAPVVCGGKNEMKNECQKQMKE